MEPTLTEPLGEVIEKSRNGEVDGDTLLRAMALHRTWLIPGRATEEGTRFGVIKKPGGGRILEVFTDREAVLTLEAEHDDAYTGELVQTTGFDWMCVLEELDVDRVNVNPGSPNTIHYKRPQVPVLTAWGRLGRAEAALYHPELVDNHLGAILGHEDYAVVVVGEEDEDSSLVLAPDAEGRRLGALFTTMSTALDFVNTLQGETEDELRAITITPEKWVPLFARLQLNGLVFNPWSALPSVALDARILEPLADALKPN